MALHDQDKQNGDRANPSLNADDNLQNRMSHKTIGTSYKAAGNQESSRIIFDKNAVVGLHDAENKDIFIGYDPNISTRPVVRIAKDGFDAIDATDDQLIFNSEQNVFKIVKTGDIIIPDVTSNKAGTSQYGFFNSTNSLPHDLGFIPAVVAFISNGASFQMLPVTRPDGVAVNAFAMLTWRITVDATNIYAISECLAFNESNTHTGGTVKYYLLQETAN